MDLKNIVVNASETLGDVMLLLGIRESFAYTNGEKGDKDGIKANVISEKAGYEKLDVKLPLVTLPFEFKEGTPIPVEFEGLRVNLWRDWNGNGAIRISATATGIKPVTSKKIHLKDNATE